jgi:predicted lipoprotein with Yx(FWY)xxD motif
MKIILAALTLLAAISVSAAHHGDVLTNKQGMTLYTFDKDANGDSACYGGCAAKWPPYLAKAGAQIKGAWGLTERKDGAKQWTYNNQPLYTWVGDSQKGDTSGNGVGGVWHTAEKMHKKAEKKVKKSNSGYGAY